MKNRMISFLLVLILSVSILGQNISYSADTLNSGQTEAKEEITDVLINPLYADILSEEEKNSIVEQLEAKEAAFLEKQARSIEAQSDIVYDNLEDAAEYVKGMMVDRVETMTLAVKSNVIGEDYWKVFNTAMDYSESCTGQEGDALSANYDGARARISIGSGTTTLTYLVTYKTTAEQEAELTKAVNTALNNLNLSGKSDYQKVRAIHDYICNHVDYDYEHLELGSEAYPLMHTAYAAMCDGTAVCQGYAVLFYRMCKDAGLNVRYISGTGNGGAHAWNIVEIGNVYYNIDTTWDGQDTNTHHTYFLQNDDDFMDHSRSTDYKTEEFYKKFPMASDSWEDYSKLATAEGLNKTNLSSMTYNTIAGETITNQANGKPKILVFGRISCYYTYNTIANLSDAEFDDMDIVFVESNRATQNEVISFRDTYGSASDDITYTYNPSGTNLWSYVSALSGNVSSITFPYIVYIDGNNNIQHYDNSGIFSANAVRQKANVYCGSQKLMSLSDNAVSLNTGTSKDLEVAVYGNIKNSQFFTWSSSNTKVATVNADGVVTAKAAGTAVITCKASDAVYATCQVTVKEVLNGLCKGADGVWHYYKNGVLDTSFTGLAKNNYGWWYVKKGTLDTTYTGMAKNEFGWWYVKNGKLDTSYTGMAKNQYGWWYMKNGKLDTSYTGMAKNQYGWWYIKNGKLDTSYTGMAKNQYGWWYIKNGKLDTSYTGMAKNQYGWFYMKNGKLDT